MAYLDKHHSGRMSGWQLNICADPPGCLACESIGGSVIRFVDLLTLICRQGTRRAIAGAALTLPLGGCYPGILDPQGPVGQAEKTILFNALAIMLVIIVPTIIATCLFAWWFRASNPRARYRPDFAYSGRIELITWSVPVLTIFFLGGLAWTGSHDLDPARTLPDHGQPLEVQVVSLDWKWLFIYPKQNVASVNDLVMPAGQPVHFTLTSSSVMNSFFVPRLGSMIYTMNGMATQLYLKADTPGTFDGLATHFSGDGFSDMSFTVHAVDQNAFSIWVGTAQHDGPVLNADSYGRLAEQSSRVKPFTYRLGELGLFDAIVSLKIAPAPGPQAGHPSPTVEPKGNI